MARLVLLILFITVIPFQVSAQEIRDASTLHYTYMGPVFSLARDSVEYKDWFGTEQGTKKMNGLSYSGGVVFFIFVDRFCGEFHLKYTRSQLDFTLNLTEFLLQGKYLFPLNEMISLSGGLGLYSEMSPSEKDHNGSAGIRLPVGFVFSVSPKWKLFFDLYAGYGSFGMGEGSTRLSYGINLGAVYRVGRI